RRGLTKVMTTTIAIVLFDGVDELDAVGPLEVLRGAAAHGADLSVRLVTRTEPLEVTGNHGLRLRADAVYQPGADILLVPGGGWLRVGGRVAGPAAGEAEAEWLEYPWSPEGAGEAAGQRGSGGHTITTEPVLGVVTARWGGEVVAESRNALLLRETGLAPVTYVPIADAGTDVLPRTHC